VCTPLKEKRYERAALCCRFGDGGLSSPQRRRRKSMMRIFSKTLNERNERKQSW
jgi:hypothetical protein